MNEKLYTKGLPKILLEIHREWMKVVIKKIKELEKHTGMHDLINENMLEYHNNVMHTHEIPNEWMLIKIYKYKPKRYKNGWGVVCSNQIFDKTRLLSRDDKNVVINTIIDIAVNPNNLSTNNKKLKLEWFIDEEKREIVITSLNKKAN